MLQNIRDNSQGWIAKTIIGIIVALMAFTGIEAIFQASTNNKQDVAKVNGEEITQSELGQAVDMQRRQLMQQLGKDFDASLLDEKLLRDAARSARMCASEGRAGLAPDPLRCPVPHGPVPATCRPPPPDSPTATRPRRSHHARRRWPLQRPHRPALPARYAPTSAVPWAVE